MRVYNEEAARANWKNSVLKPATLTPKSEGGEPKDDNGSVEALAKEFKGQRWNADKSVWK